MIVTKKTDTELIAKWERTGLLQMKYSDQVKLATNLEITANHIIVWSTNRELMGDSCSILLPAIKRRFDSNPEFDIYDYLESFKSKIPEIQIEYNRLLEIHKTQRIDYDRLLVDWVEENV